MAADEQAEIVGSARDVGRAVRGRRSPARHTKLSDGRTDGQTSSAV